VHWFTGQSGVYGRLDPASGKMEVFDAPKGRGPYGIHSTPDGSGLLRVARGILRRQDQPRRQHHRDPAADAAPGRAPRLVRLERRCLGRGVELGQSQPLSPKSGAWKTWKAPGNTPQVYAVYVDETDKVWASEWTAQVMLRFDPATEKFESFKSSSSRPNVRQIHGPQG
jgi:virginiamycin B lyase